MYELNSEYMDRESAGLAYIITGYMIEKELTLVVLEKASDIVRNVYCQNATVKNKKETQ